MQFSFNPRQLINFGVFAGFTFYASGECFFTVDAGHYAIVFNRVYGLKKSTYREGFHLKLPFFDIPYIYDIRTKPKEITT